MQDLQTGGMYGNALIDGPFVQGEKFGDIWSIYNSQRHLVVSEIIANYRADSSLPSREFSMSILILRMLARN